MEGNSEDAIKNKLVEQYLKVLTTLEYTNQLKVSIDNATDTVKSVLEKIESKKEVNHQTPFQVYSPHYQEEVKSEYTKGKSGIGPFALNNAHHILTLLMGVKFKSNEFTEALNLIDLDKQYDDDGSGRRILDWLSAMINAFVDIAKDPYIVRLNVNPYTFNMTAYLLRMGKGEQTFYFLKQPVIDAVAKAVLNTRGNYGKDNTKTQFEVEKEATQKVLDSFGITENVLEALREILKDPANLAIHLESLFSGELEKMLLSDNISQEDKNKYQAKVWLAWQAMTPYAKDMADLVKYSKVDTKKMGKSFAAQRIFENGIDRIKDESETRFEYGVLDNFFDNTFLTTKAENSIVFGRSLFENQLLRTTPKFVLTLDNILYRLGKSKSIDERLLRTIVGSMEAAIKSEYFNQKMQDKGITPADFFYGDNTIARRLMKLRNRIYRGELNDLKNNVVGFNNALLNFLIPNTVKYETTFTEPDYVDVKTMFDQDVHSKNMIITAWEELLQHYDEEVRTLAEDLIYYSFLTSGDNKNMNSFFEFVPTSWRKEYSQFLQDKLDNNETSVNYRDIYLNNWLNNDIVPRIEQSYREERMGTEGEMVVEEQYFEGIRSKYTLTGSSFAPYIMFTGKAGSKNRIKPISWYKQRETNKAGLAVTRSYPVYPSFVKIRYGSTNSPTSYVVYELIGYNMEATKAGNINYIPIYVAVNKKGYRYKGHVITEYGQYQGHMFNLMSIGVTSEDFVNGNVVNLINKSKNLSEEQKKQYSLTFGKNFRSISTLPSYINLAISDMYGTISEQEDISFELEVIPETTEDGSINIYYGAGENADLSNFAERPFEFEGVRYRNVESAFQSRKLDYSDFYHYPDFGGPKDSYFEMLEKFENTTGPEARKLGRQIIGLNQAEWNKHSSDIMKKMIIESFKQNPSALKRLLATGNSVLTHNLDKGKWGKEFPRILMEVRDELKQPQEGNVLLNNNILTISKSKLPEKYHALSDKIINTALLLGIKFEIADLGDGVSGRFVANDLTVYYNPENIQDNTILHEAIHAITSYYFNIADRENLPNNIKTALSEIEYCHKLLKEDFVKQNFYENGKLKEGINVEKAFEFWTDDNDLYGLKSPTELIAEITKPSIIEFIRNFDSRNKGKNIFDKLIDSILSLFGISKKYTSVEKTIKDAMLEIINNPSKELLNRYAVEISTVKQNIKSLKNSSHIAINANHVLIKPQFDKFFEDNETNSDSAQMNLIIPLELAKNQGYVITYPTLSLSKKPLTSSRKGTIFIIDEHLYGSLNSNVTVDSENVTIPLTLYTKEWMSTHNFNITHNDNGIDYIVDVTDTFNTIKSSTSYPSEYTNHSGGARGSDSIWDKIGREFGVINHRHYYQGERSEHNAPLGNTEITTEDYEEGRYKVAQAAKRNYGYQYSAMKDPRLIRNWSQVKYADAIFAIGKIVQPGEKIFPNKLGDTRLAVSPSVTGGTGYAVGMAINEGKPVHVFDQSKKSWFVWNGENFIQEETPVLTKNFAGIGTRKIDPFGEQAIRDVYDKTFESEDYKDKEGEKVKKQCKGE